MTCLYKGADQLVIARCSLPGHDKAMNKIDKDELFGQVNDFLKAKGIELHEGVYTRTIQKGCQMLADTINLSQQAMERAKVELDKTLDQARQAIHEKTAPRTPPVSPQPQSPAQTTPNSSSQEKKARLKAAAQRRSSPRKKKVPKQATQTKL